jgi:hypothetical protein
MTTDVNERTKFLHWGEEEHKGGPITCNNTHTKEQASTKNFTDNFGPDYISK